MKIYRKFRRFFMFTWYVLYVSGLAFFVFEHFFQVQGEFGWEPHPWQIPTLHFHGIIGLGFLILMGHLYAVHIRPSLRGRRKRTSGIFLLVCIAMLCLTVPGLYYLGDVYSKNSHSYLGLATLLPFLIHVLHRDRIETTKTSIESKHG